MAWRKCDCDGDCMWPYTAPCKVDTARERSKDEVRATRSKRVRVERTKATAAESAKKD